MESEKYPDKLVFGLDIGTRSIVGTVGYRVNKQFIVVAQSIREHETRAMIDGQIHDINKVSETIRVVKAELESQLDHKLTEVCIAAAGRVLKTVKVMAEYEFPCETTVNEDHIRSLDLIGVEKAYNTLREELKKDRINFYCVGYSVINYTLNGYTIFKLNGHKANRIGSELLATFLPDEVINGLYTAVESAGLQVASLTLEPIAAINVAIPENYRLLNIAMVDVGAGTSDISITKDGSIIAYGMIPNAGDEITEAIAEKYLVDFKTAEKIKTSCLKKKTVSFKNVMGTGYKLTTEEILNAVTEIVHKITKSIADKIIELNGGKSVSAVFVVGGGGKIPGFVTSLADYLKLPQDRVALRGEDVLKSVTSLEKHIKKDSLMVTPIGICLNYYDQSNNFIFVNVNNERVKLYDNGKLTISDAAVQLGYSNEQLFPMRGKALKFILDGTSRTLKGGLGEAARIRLNGEAVGITHEIKHNDSIEIVPSTAGREAQYEIRQLPEYKNTITFQVNGSKVQCPKLVLANGKMVSEFYSIKENDEINILNCYTIKQILEFMDIIFEGDIKVNHTKAGMDTKIYENDTVQFTLNREEKPAKTEVKLAKAYDDPSDKESKSVSNDKPNTPDIDKESSLRAEKSATEQTYVKVSVNQSNLQKTGKQKIPSDWFIMKPKDTAEKKSQKQTNEPDWMKEYKQVDLTGNTQKQQNEPEWMKEYKFVDLTGSSNKQQGGLSETTQYPQSESSSYRGNSLNNSSSNIGNSLTNSSSNIGNSLNNSSSNIRNSLNNSSSNVNNQEANSLQNTANQENQNQDIYVTVNGKVVKLSNKPQYIYVDILDFYPFDLSSMKGTELVTMLNGERVDFTAPVKEKDKIEIFWKK